MMHLGRGGWSETTTVVAAADYREAAEILPATWLIWGSRMWSSFAGAVSVLGLLGYQVTGYYAPASQFGSPDDFRYWWIGCTSGGRGARRLVAAHFPRTTGRWPGSTARRCTSTRPRQGSTPTGAAVFNYGRTRSAIFLLANALYWIEEFHMDGCGGRGRLDALPGLLPLRGGVGDEPVRGRENLEAVSFIKEVNEVSTGTTVVMMVAEESTSWPAVSRPIYLAAGLGSSGIWGG